MKTLGIDLAASPRKTAVCEIDWANERVTLQPRGLTDEQLVHAIVKVDMAGIDVPLGWPDAFVDMVSRHHDVAGPAGEAPPEDRNALRFRFTDRFVQERGGRPLSVSTDRIGVTAMRAARIQFLLGERGRAVDRSGMEPPLAEVYPAAALKSWGMQSTRYTTRAHPESCHRIAAALAAECGALSVSVSACLRECDDDDLDAVVCAVVAKAVHDGATTPPPDDARELARREGWIHVPFLPIGSITVSS